MRASSATLNRRPHAHAGTASAAYVSARVLRSRRARVGKGDLCAPKTVAHTRAWTASAVLPGGDFSELIGAPTQPDADFARFVAELARRHPDLSAALVQRWARAYGSRAERVLGPDGLGAEVAPGLFEAELRYLHRCEWARSADDVLWRRSKLGLHYTSAERDSVARWCADHWGAVDGVAARMS
jgi:glycerol-3-phosphate dehydrogenase